MVISVVCYCQCSLSVVFEVIGLEFAGPIKYRVRLKSEGKVCIALYSCSLYFGKRTNERSEKVSFQTICLLYIAYLTRMKHT